MSLIAFAGCKCPEILLCNILSSKVVDIHTKDWTASKCVSFTWTTCQMSWFQDFYYNECMSPSKQFTFDYHWPRLKHVFTISDVIKDMGWTKQRSTISTKVG